MSKEEDDDNSVVILGNVEEQHQAPEDRRTYALKYSLCFFALTLTLLPRLVIVDNFIYQLFITKGFRMKYYEIISRQSRKYIRVDAAVKLFMNSYYSFVIRCYCDFREVISMEKRYFTSALDSLS
jgi:hypothetical protein